MAGYILEILHETYSKSYSQISLGMHIKMQFIYFYLKNNLNKKMKGTLCLAKRQILIVFLSDLFNLYFSYLV
jgi:hypothetical protein